MSAEDAPPPSGEQVVLQHGAHRAVVVTAGGGIREYSVDGVAVLDGYAEQDLCDGGRGQLLLPWPNRLRDGRYRWGGRDLQVPLSEPERENAIHGLTRWMPWTVVERGTDAALLRLDLPPQPGYPFSVRFEVAYRLGDAGLAVAMRAANRGDRPAPVGMGAHPYIAAGGTRADDLTLHVPAAQRLLVDERGIPRGDAPVDGSAFDFREPRTVGDAVLDLAYTELARDADGRARVTLEAPRGMRVSLWMDATFVYAMVFTGDTLAPERRRQSVAVEPMTCAPNALQSGDGLRTLQPGETLEGWWGVAPGAGTTP